MIRQFLVSMIVGVATLSANEWPDPIVKFNGKAYFAARTDAAGRELWVSDGTPYGTKLLKDIFVGPESSSPNAFAVIGSSRLFFTADDGAGSELWSTNGTTTRPVTDFTDGSYVFAVTAAASYAVFAVQRPDYSWEIWRSNSTGTSYTKLTSLGTNQTPLAYTCIGDVFYYATVNVETDMVKVQKLSIGTGSITTILEFAPGQALAIRLTAAAGRLYISATISIADNFYVYNPATSALTFLTNFDPGTVTLMTVAGSYFYLFGSRPDDIGAGLYRTDGTAAGTRGVAAMEPASPPIFAVQYKTLFFRSGTDLLKVSGTGAPAMVMADAGEVDAIVATNSIAAPSSYASQYLFYTTANHTQLWKITVKSSSATATQMVTATGSNLYNLTPITTSAILFTDQADTNYRLRKTTTTSTTITTLNSLFN
jgi:ELWxxDGT repeat protein